MKCSILRALYWLGILKRPPTPSFSEMVKATLSRPEHLESVKAHNALLREIQKPGNERIARDVGL